MRLESEITGIRFRPGAAASLLGTRQDEITDLNVCPEDLQRRPIVRRLEDLADQAGLSLRQFRRPCLEGSGLSPKLLGPILRFRRALALVASSNSGNWADIAADCGYFDQAHLIRDFRQFTGESPMAVLSRYSLLLDMAVPGSNQQMPG